MPKDAAVLRKEKILGMTCGKAGGRLQKKMLFKLAQLCGCDNCFRCGEKITSVSTFSMDHKIAWQSAPDPIATFFDTDNIAFSHRSCNSVSRAYPNSKTHCLQGHDMALYGRQWGKRRRCMLCERGPKKAWKHKKKIQDLEKQLEEARRESSEVTNCH